jgi:segregation and condensation protein B
LTPKALCKLLDSEPKEDVLASIGELKQDYERPGGLQLVEVAGGYQIVTRSDLHEWVRRLFHERSSQKLSVQALETLAVIAYRQPVTAAEITEIRGVNTSGVLNTLLERHLIKIVGRKQVVGRPFMYSSTKEFLIRFGLNDLDDLPKVEDMAEALGIENPLLLERVTSEDLLPIAEPEGDDPSGDPTDGSEQSPPDRSDESLDLISDESLDQVSNPPSPEPDPDRPDDHSDDRWSERSADPADAQSHHPVSPPEAAADEPDAHPHAEPHPPSPSEGDDRQEPDAEEPVEPAG